MSLIGRPRKGFNVTAYNQQKREREERRQLRCDHVWQHESIIQPGGRGYSTSWCSKCKISAHEYTKASALASHQSSTLGE